MYLRSLMPPPLRFREDEERKFHFASAVTAQISGIPIEICKQMRFLWRRFCCDASEVTFVPVSDGCLFRIGEVDCELFDDDRYAIRVTETGICMRATDAQSLMHGFTTLMQLICPVELEWGKESFYISAAEVHDKPALDFRGIHLCVFPETTLADLEKAIRLAGFYKMTHVVLEFWGTLRYDCLPSLAWRNHSYTKDEIRPLIELIRSFGMEPIPMINHFGHASQSRGAVGRHTVLNTNLRLSRLFEPDGWTWCLSNPDTYALLAQMRAELCELFGDGQYFHLGFDEAYSFATCDCCRQRVPHELLAEYLNRLTSDLAKIGRHPIIWHDELIRGDAFPNPDFPVTANGQNHNTSDALELLDRRIVIADWQYEYRNNYNPTTGIFLSRGFDTLTCPWFDPENARSLANNAKTMGAFGVLITTWNSLFRYLRRAGYFGAVAWCSEDPEKPSLTDGSYTEVAAILRKVYNSDGDFNRSGWREYELEYDLD